MRTFFDLIVEEYLYVFLFITLSVILLHCIDFRFLVAVLAREDRMNEAVKEIGHTVGPVHPENPSMQIIVQQSESQFIGRRIAEVRTYVSLIAKHKCKLRTEHTSVLH